MKSLAEIISRNIASVALNFSIFCGYFSDFFPIGGVN